MQIRICLKHIIAVNLPDVKVDLLTASASNLMADQVSTYQLKIVIYVDIQQANNPLTSKYLSTLNSS